MSDIIRVDLSEKEAAALDATLRMAILRLSEVPVEVLTVRAKLVKAQQNPLNGPTFDFAKHSDVEIPEAIDPQEIPF